MTSQTASLGDVAEFVNGVAFKETDWGDQGRPIIRIQNLNDARKPFNRTFREVPDRNLARKGDLLVSWAASLGVYEWNGEEACINQHIFKVIPDFSRVDQQYLRRALEASLSQMEQETHGATMKHITRDRFLGIPIKLPSITEQRRIAAILDKADALRAKRRDAIAKLDQLLQSVFLDMFGDQVLNTHGWDDSRHLGDVAEIASGVTKGRRTTAGVRGVPYLAVSNVQDRFLKLDVVKRIDATEAEIARYRLQDGDLLLTEGGDPDKLGRGALWDGSLSDCIHQNHVFRVRLISDDLHPVYLNWHVGSARGKRYFASQAKQTTGIASINMRQLRNFPLLIPPLSLQLRFARLFEGVEQQRHALQQINRKVDDLFASLQHRAFSGTL